MDLYKDWTADPKERAKDLMKRMSFEEKAGQLVGCVEIEWSSDDLERDYPHGAGQIAFLGAQGKKTILEAAQYQRETQKRVMDLSEHGIPAFFHVEGVCGVLLSQATSLPSGIGQGATFDPALQKRLGTMVGKQAAVVGASQVFAPVLDISRDARFGRQGESYGEDPALAASMGTAFVQGLQGNKEYPGVMGVAKHFLGYHDAQGGIHAAVCDIPERLLEEVYAKPFQAAITEGGLRGVMPCYSSINGEPVTISEKILTELLRDRMGFDGVAVSDYSAISEVFTRQKVCESMTEAGKKALEAGMHQELPSANCCKTERVKAYMEDPEFCRILDDRVEKILEEKFRLGLFEHPFAEDDSTVTAVYADQDNQKLVLEAARKSLVLLKNTGILPLSAENCRKKIAVIGHHADSARVMFGGYTFISMTESSLGTGNTMAGTGNTGNVSEKKQLHKGSIVECEHPDAEKVVYLEIPGIHSLLDEMKEQWPEASLTYSYGYPYVGDDCSRHKEALQAASEADIIIMTVGGKYGTGSTSSMGEGIDAVDVNLPLCQELLIKKAGQLGKPLILIHFGGRPVSSDAADTYADAILEVWNPGEKGAQAIVETMDGRNNPGGRLPVSVPYCAGQIPVYYNHPNGSSYHQGVVSAFDRYVDCPHEPRYFFGYGLSYTTFQYESLVLEQKEVVSNGELCFRVTVTNTGNYAGEEVVQAYIRDCQASMVRPVQELVGFHRVFLEAGEKKYIQFRVKASQLAFLNGRMEYMVERGNVELMVGASSEDIRLRDMFFIHDTALVDGKNRGFYAETEELQRL